MSVVICCHNSAERLPPTLAHLSAQRVPPGLAWEVVVVDNASTDGTADTARIAWPAVAPAPLRVLHEPVPGLVHARQRGLAEAKYELVCFVDDDNWVCPEWVQVAAEVMAAHPEVGACGGRSESVCEVDPPWWFERHRRNYAVGVQGQEAGYVFPVDRWLWGAGLVIRTAACRALVAEGCYPLLTGRQGTRLTAGEDAELCYALRLSGWQLWYEPRLAMRHFLPTARLNWHYLRAINRGFGAANVGLIPYRIALQGSTNPLKGRLRAVWQLRSLVALLRLLRYKHKLLVFSDHSREGDADVLQIERAVGLLSELLRWRGAFDASIRAVRLADWQPGPATSTHS